MAPDGVVDRTAVADRAFASVEERRWLEGLVWPRVADRIAQWREQLERRRPRPPAAVVEVPLLFEAGMESIFEATVAVIADEQLRARRAAARGHARVAERAAAQLSQDEKASRATYVVRNDADEVQLELALGDVIRSLRA